MVDYSVELQETLFSFLEQEEVKLLLKAMDRVHYDAGSHLFRKGDPADCLYFLLSGRVAVQKKTGFGDKTQVVALLDPGAPAGERGLLGGKRRGATIVAVKDSELLVLSGVNFENLVDESPVVAVKLLKWLLNRVSLRLEKNSERLALIL